MHIILGALGTIVTILWLLHRLAEMGIDLGGLNPWLWRRRRNWKQRYEANPVYSLDSPLEVTALVVTAIAKADGDLSSQEKQEILSVFESEFALSATDASDLLASSAHLLGDGVVVRENLEAVFAASLDRFSQEQANSAVELFARIAQVGGEASGAKRKLVDQASAILSAKFARPEKWQ